jgi:hypothetical protein
MDNYQRQVDAFLRRKGLTEETLPEAIEQCRQRGDLERLFKLKATLLLLRALRARPKAKRKRPE